MTPPGNQKVNDKTEQVGFSFGNVEPKNFVFLGLIISLMVVFFGFAAPGFFSWLNVMNMLKQSAEVGMMAVPLTFVIICGAMDLSVGSILGLSAITLGTVHTLGFGIWISIIPALIVGLLCGFLNGYLVGKFNMEGIMVTIGTMVMLRGLVYIITEGRPISGYPSSFYILGQGTVLGIPINAWVMGVVFGLGYILLNKTRFGRHLYAAGNNEEVTYYSGISVFKTRLSVYLMSGFLAALAGVFRVSRLASAEATTGDGAELIVITSVLLGGTHIFGGKGSILGTFLGMSVVIILQNGLNLMGVSSLYRNVILGFIILIAVAKQNQ